MMHWLAKSRFLKLMRKMRWTTVIHMRNFNKEDNMERKPRIQGNDRKDS